MSFTPVNYVNGITTVGAAWLNGVDVTCNFVLNGAQTVLQAQTALGFPTAANPLAIGIGGTGATTAAGALVNLGVATTLFPITAQEAAASVTPVDFWYPPGDPRRYGWVATDLTGTSGYLGLQTSLSVVQQTTIPAGLTLYTPGGHTMVAGASFVGGAVSQTGGTANLLNISVSNVLVNRVSMNCAAQTGPNRNAVYISGSNLINIEISDCHVTAGRILESGTGTTVLKVLRNIMTGASVGNSNAGGVITIGNAAAVGTFEVSDNIVYSTDGTGIIFYNGCIGGVIQGNICTGNYGDGIGVDGGSAGCLELTIANNICKYNGEGNSGGGVGISHHFASATLPQRNTIIGNVCAYNNADGFDLVSNASSAQYTYLTCSGNVSEANGTNVSGYAGGGTGFNIYYCSSSTFTGNIALGNSTHGFEVYGGSTVSFAANQAISNGGLSAGTYMGFNLNSCTNSTLMGNIANNLGGGLNQSYGIHEDTGCNGNVISGNNCVNNLNGTTLVQGATTILRDDVGGYIDQEFTWTLSNNAGTLQHSFYAQAGANSLGNYVSRINNASPTATNTPTGTDSSTAMAAGGKIGSANTNYFWFDTGVQVNALADACASVETNGTAGLLFVSPQLQSININGVTQNRLVFVFTSASAAAVALTTSNIGSGKSIQVKFKGRLN